MASTSSNGALKMPLNERSGNDVASLRDRSSTVVAGTPNRARAQAGSTAPLGGPKPVAAAAPVAINTQAPTRVVTPSTARGLFQAAPAARGRLWETVVGVGPSLLRSLAAGAAGATARESARGGAPSTSPNGAVAKAASKPALASVAAKAAPSSAAASSVDSDGTQVSPAAPRRDAQRLDPPSFVPRRPAPSSKGRPESRFSRPGLFRKAAVEARREGSEQAQVDFLAGFKPKGWSILLLLSSL